MRHAIAGRNFRPVVTRMLEQLQDEAAKRFREYLLGGLKPRQRAAIERQILTNESVFQELRAAEDALVQDYLDNTLPPNVTERFRMLLSGSKTWREKVEFARALRVVTQRASSPGAADAERLLFESVFSELQKLAVRLLGRERLAQFEPDDLLNEAYLRLSAQGLTAKITDKVKFFALAANVMRHVLVDHARAAARSPERGGNSTIPLQDVTLQDADVIEPELMLDIDRALTDLAAKMPRQSRVLELKMFSGLSDEEVAHALGVTKVTVRRALFQARLWLKERLQMRRSVN
jgi:RNA polymerase sigma factor (TIGR02999 family)